VTKASPDWQAGNAGRAPLEAIGASNRRDHVDLLRAAARSGPARAEFFRHHNAVCTGRGTDKNRSQNSIKADMTADPRRIIDCVERAGRDFRRRQVNAPCRRSVEQLSAQLRSFPISLTDAAPSSFSRSSLSLDEVKSRSPFAPAALAKLQREDRRRRRCPAPDRITRASRSHRQNRHAGGKAGAVQSRGSAALCLRVPWVQDVARPNRPARHRHSAQLPSPGTAGKIPAFRAARRQSTRGRRSRTTRSPTV